RGIAAHAAWKARLKAAIAAGKLEIPVSKIKVDNECRFGTWLYGSALSGAEEDTEQCRRVKELHKQFHEETARIAQLAIAGQKDAAEKAMGPAGEFHRISSELTAALTKWSAVLESAAGAF